MLDLFELTKSLIHISSSTGEEEEAVFFLKEYFESSGFNVELQKVEKGRCNIFAKINDPEIVLSTHIDTVIPFLPFEEDEENIYGRGACDAKGILASQIKAVERLKASGYDKIGILVVVGEEGGSDGAKAANFIENNCRFLINGEPTENKLATGTKGALRIELRADGIAGHSAYPDQGESAILKLLDIFQRWRELDFPEDDIFGKTTWNIGRISGGKGANIIPDSAKAEIMFRTVCDVKQIKSILTRHTDNLQDIIYHYEADPVKLEIIDGFKTTVVSFATDIPLLNNWGRPFLIGPGSILQAHTENEFVKKSELREAVGLYCKLVNQLRE